MWYTILVTKKYIKNPCSSTTENAIQYNNAQNIEKKRNENQIETTNTINLNPSNISKCKLVRKDTSNTKNNSSIQQKKHNKFAFIVGDSMFKDIGGYLLTRPIKSKIYREGETFFIGQNGEGAVLY